MHEILLNYEGIIGAIAGAVLATIATLITTHILRNSGKVDVEIFDESLEIFEKDPYRKIGSLQLQFKIKFYNTSETPKVIDDIEIAFKGSNKEIYKSVPYDQDTLKSSSYSRSFDKLFFVNLPPKQLTLKKLNLEITEREINNFSDIKFVELRYFNKKTKKKAINVHIN